jgi:hypothetical protein
VHRDLKPANIMVDPDGGVKIMDFGIARLFQGTGQLTGTMIGTPAYMAPEQLELKRVDARTDIYALGLLLYEMVTGSQPFPGDTPIAVALKHIREIPQRPREVVPTLPAHAEAVIMKCLQKDPAMRFQSVNELMMALNRGASRRPQRSQWECFRRGFQGIRPRHQAWFSSGCKTAGILATARLAGAVPAAFDEEDCGRLGSRFPARCRDRIFRAWQPKEPGGWIDRQPVNECCCESGTEFTDLCNPSSHQG